MSSPIIAPSILAADFGRLAAEVRAVDAAGADWIHVDVMDGRFVPNITVGPLAVKAIRRVTSKPLSVHLMITEPERFIDDFVRAGTDHLIVHAEAAPREDLYRCLQRIGALGNVAGIAISPATGLERIEHVLHRVGLVLVMTVNPGFGGQPLLPETLDKVRQLKAMCYAQGVAPWIAVDGGISVHTIALASHAGAGVFVAGSAIYAQPDYAAAIRALRIAGSAG